MTRARDLAAFVSNADGDIKFDTDTLFIDSSANRVGIGTSSPSKSLHVVGDVLIQDPSPTIQFEDTDNNYIAEISGASGSLLLKADTGNGTSGESMQFHTGGTERMRINSDGRVGIGTTSPDSAYKMTIESTASEAGIRVQGDNARIACFENGSSTIGAGPNFYMQNVSGGTYAATMQMGASAEILFLQYPNSGAWSERMRIDSSGVVLIGMTSANGVGATPSDVNGTEIGRGYINLNRDDSAVVRHIQFGTNGSGNAALGTNGGDLFLGTEDTCLIFHNDLDSIIPGGVNAAGRDNAIDMGQASNRFDDIFATNGTIQTSDEREKQQIASLTDAEITAAKAISKLFKTFKWNDKVEAKGDDARTHTGVIAQQVETAMSDAGLNAGDYAFFISTTWWETQTEVAAVEADEENGIEAQEAYTRTDTYNTLEEAPEGATEHNRKGIRYPELLSFIGAATEQRLTSIEARLDALEG